MMMTGEQVLIPDDRAFSRFKRECQSEEDWSLTYNKNSICVWIQVLEEDKSLHKIKVSGSDLASAGLQLLIKRFGGLEDQRSQGLMFMSSLLRK